MMLNVISCKHNQKKGTQTIKKKKGTRNTNVKDVFSAVYITQNINLKS